VREAIDVGASRPPLILDGMIGEDVVMERLARVQGVLRVTVGGSYCNTQRRQRGGGRSGGWRGRDKRRLGRLRTEAG
jgi:hypothetical protein